MRNIILTGLGIVHLASWMKSLGLESHATAKKSSVMSCAGGEVAMQRCQ
ncbi:hypothetical protein ACO0LM_19965 [Undibacterium sp. Di26W]